jgi:hypothetical protein
MPPPPRPHVPGQKCLTGYLQNHVSSTQLTPDAAVVTNYEALFQVIISNAHAGWCCLWSLRNPLDLSPQLHTRYGALAPPPGFGRPHNAYSCAPPPRPRPPTFIMTSVLPKNGPVCCR